MSGRGNGGGEGANSELSVCPVFDKKERVCIYTHAEKYTYEDGSGRIHNGFVQNRDTEYVCLQRWLTGKCFIFYKSS